MTLNGKAAKVLRRFAEAVNRDPDKLKAFYIALPAEKRHQLISECERAIHQLEVNKQKAEAEAKKKRLQDFAKVLQI